MEQGTDWIRLWRELSQTQIQSWQSNQSSESDQDTWRNRARDFHKMASRRSTRTDSSRDLIISQLDACPGSSLVDIGAGTGAWSIPLAKHARLVTAVDPSQAMIEVLEENLAAAEITNVEIVRGRWPDVQVQEHDFSLCSHAMYGYADFPLFVRRMEEVTRRMCFLVMRAPTPDGLLAEASMHIWGHMYDSPNFQVAYNAMLQMGIFPNVLMENTGLWAPWTSATFEEAFAEMKRRFRLEETDTYDDYLAGLLRRRLTLVDGKYEWPRGVRSALIYWEKSTSGQDQS
jgi:precorrin-6B methylase 2